MRKDVIRYKTLNAVDISTDQTSNTTYVTHGDNIGIQIMWNGSSPIGEIFIDGSNGQENPNEPMVWSDIGITPSVIIAGNSGDHSININQFPFNAIRVRYVSTSGTGSLTAILMAKMV